MKLWWLTDIARVRAEKASVEQLAADEGWFSLTRWWINDDRFSADGVLTAHGVPYPVRLIYPDQFPSVPAWVEPQNPDAHWSVHQYGKGGPLCLELRPDNWSSKATGADLLRSAFKLLQSENPLGEGMRSAVVSAHRVGNVQSYAWGQYPTLIGAGCLARIREGTAKTVRALRWSALDPATGQHAEDSVLPILVFDDIDAARPQHPRSFDLGTLRFELPVQIVRGEAPVPAPSNRADLETALGIQRHANAEQGALVAIAVGAERMTLFYSPDENSVFERKWVVLPEQAGLRSGRREAAVGKSVAVVGLGSVGSKIAETLLRSGVHRLALVDGDVLLPGNLERHALDWRDVGFRKVHGVKRRLLHLVPGASVNVIAANLNWQRSSHTHANQLDALAECDLIVDATGDVPSGLMLGAVAAENKKSFVSVEVFEGGLGCVVARSIPGRDPAYVAGRAAFTAYCDQENVAPPTSGGRTYEALTEGGEPLIADDAAVAIAAAHGSRVVLDILDGQVAKEESPWLLIGFRSGWLFKRHGHAIALDVGTVVADPAFPEEDRGTREFVLALAKEALGATNSSG